MTTIEPRQRLLGMGIILVAAIALGLLVAAFRAPNAHVAAPASSTPPASNAPQPTPAASVSAAPAPPGPAIPPEARTKVYTSATKSSGKYRANTITAQPGAAAKRTNDYIVRVETTVDADPDDVARQVQATLDDKRSWVGYGNNNFRLVTKAGKGVLTIYLAAPKTVDKLCAPLEMESKWNCRVGNTVVLNSDRWFFMTPTYDDLAAYRAYMVNHEVGHFLGQGHATCRKPKGLAPVMLQQSIDLDGCRPNAWPKASS